MGWAIGYRAVQPLLELEASGIMELFISTFQRVGYVPQQDHTLCSPLLGGLEEP